MSKNSTKDPEDKDLPKTPEDEGSSSEEAKADKSPKSKVCEVLNKSGNPAREYSLEQHGKKFKELAAEYAKKIGGTTQSK